MANDGEPAVDGHPELASENERLLGKERDPAGADRDHAGAGGVTRLERSALRLLHVYPAAYRRERGEEIIGTLLEATPEGRNWPRVRDARALVVSGLTARAAQNRRRPVGVNLRVAVMTGLAIYTALWCATSSFGYSRQRYALELSLLAVLVVAGILWIAIDARLMVAVLTFFALTAMEMTMASFPSGAAIESIVQLLLVIATLTAAGGWLLRRQSARAMRAK
jgi:hypothetical protein